MYNREPYSAYVASQANRKPFYFNIVPKVSLLPTTTIKIKFHAFPCLTHSFTNTLSNSVYTLVLGQLRYKPIHPRFPLDYVLSFFQNSFLLIIYIILYFCCIRVVRTNHHQAKSAAVEANQHIYCPKHPCMLF